MLLTGTFRFNFWKELNQDVERLKPGAGAEELQEELASLATALLPSLGEKFLLVDSTWLEPEATLPSR